MKILIAGASTNSLLLAKYINMQDATHDIFVTQKDDGHYDFCTCLSIRENDIAALVSFVKYNQIEFTIVLSELAVINGIADEFQNEGFCIFAPAAMSARITYFNSIAKKILYKLKIPVPRFGIFDRENLAVDYIRNIKMPIVIENDFTLVERLSDKYETFSKAKIGIQKMFESKNEKIIIESFIEGKIVCLYFITDGYSAFPLVSIEREDYGNFTVINSPSNKISEAMTVKILRSVIYPLLDDIAKFAQPYTGILGLKLKVNKNSFWVYEFYNTFQNTDLQVFLSLLNENISDLIYDTANGSLADSRDYVKLNNNYSYSLVIDKEFIRSSPHDDDDIFITEYNTKVMYTIPKSTFNSAETALIDSLENAVDDKILSEIADMRNKREIEI